MTVDAHTFKDLEIFESDTGTCLFEFCNLTQTEGGTNALRRRMERPWSNAARIRATQESLSFILARREAFDKLPSLAYTTRRVEHYLDDVLAVITHENALEFGFGVLELRLNRDLDYSRIVRGVQITCRLVRTLRVLVRQAELTSPPGELAPLIEETRSLLAGPKVLQVPDEEIGDRGVWTILRIDQIFRVHERVTMVRLLELVYEIDALVALADVTRRHDFVLPRVAEGPLAVQAEGSGAPAGSERGAEPRETRSRTPSPLPDGP